MLSSVRNGMLKIRVMWNVLVKKVVIRIVVISVRLSNVD